MVHLVEQLSWIANFLATRSELSVPICIDSQKHLKFCQCYLPRELGKNNG